MSKESAVRNAGIIGDLMEEAFVAKMTIITAVIMICGVQEGLSGAFGIFATEAIPACRKLGVTARKLAGLQTKVGALELRVRS